MAATASATKVTASITNGAPNPSVPTSRPAVAGAATAATVLSACPSADRPADLVRLDDRRHQRLPDRVRDDLAGLEGDDEGVDPPERVDEREAEAARGLPEPRCDREAAKRDGVDEPSGDRRQRDDGHGGAEEQSRDRPRPGPLAVDAEQEHEQRQVVAEGAERPGGEHDPQVSVAPDRRIVKHLFQKL